MQPPGLVSLLTIDTLSGAAGRDLHRVLRDGASTVARTADLDVVAFLGPERVPATGAPGAPRVGVLALVDRDGVHPPRRARVPLPGPVADRAPAPWSPAAADLDDLGPRPLPRHLLGLPVLGHGQHLGWLLVGRDATPVDAREPDLRQAVAGLAGALLQGLADLVERLAPANPLPAGSASRRSEQLRRMTALLSRTATPAEIGRRAPRELARIMECSSAAVYLLDTGGRTLRGHGHPALPPELAHLADVGVDDDHPVAECVRTRTPGHVTRERARRYRAFQGLDPAGLGGILVVPLLDRTGQVLGAVNVNWTQDGYRPPEEVELVTSLARQIAPALERAALLTAERRAVAALADVAATLQRSLLPRRLPTVAGVDVAVRYRPASGPGQVGGDWYDLLHLGPHVVAMIGDVQGHSTAASALMGQLRTVLRAYLSEGHDPAEALLRTNALLLTMDEDLFATCCLVRLDPRTGSYEVTSAGHHAPLLARDGVIEELPLRPGPPLGVCPAARYPTALGRLEGRSRWLLFTDGLVETRDDPTAGLSRLRELLGHPGLHREDLAEQLLRHPGTAAEDDTALLVLDVETATAPPPPAVAGRSLLEAALPLGQDLGAAGRARAFLRRVLTSWRALPVLDEAELVLSELVTNAVVHGGGASCLRLRFERGRDRLTLVVQDASPTLPAPRTADEDALGGRGLGIVELVAEEWGVTTVTPAGSGKAVWATLRPAAG
ncbi:SpoIIE family protein phosphatase [Kineococcus gynurae]|uniref:SpoIIE family protein phosphatase n=1 Tax=Kineococcus gynurae TaxID=452979 RepID=A0ABV5LPU5_9ACTN